MKPEFLIERQGKQFALYAGILDEAHQQGLKSIETMIVQIPSQDNGNVAIVTAHVETERGVFAGIGDASPQNVARPMVTCLLRFAETRAKARALRDAINVGVAAVEEMGEEEAPAPRPTPMTPKPVRQSEPPGWDPPATRAASNASHRPVAPPANGASKPAPTAVSGPANGNPAAVYIRESKSLEAYLLKDLNWEKDDVTREMARMITAQKPSERLGQLRTWRAELAPEVDA